jgi:methionyl aminopeptidase
MIRLKSKLEIDLLREGGKILSSVLKRVIAQVKPGVTTAELNELAENLILEKGGRPSFKEYGGPEKPFPAGLCTSINEQLVHGMPNVHILKQGDIISLDIGMEYPKENGLFTDMAVTVAVGKVPKETKKLMKVTRKSLDLWIHYLKPGKQLNEIAGKVQDYIEREGFQVIRDLVGHGVGHAVHEEPQIPNYFMSGLSVELKEGMVLAIEPMVSAGDYRIQTKSDGWTVETIDKSLTAHYEHTIAITKKGCEILTK